MSLVSNDLFIQIIRANHGMNIMQARKIVKPISDMFSTYAKLHILPGFREVTCKTDHGLAILGYKSRDEIIDLMSGDPSEYNLMDDILCLIEDVIAVESRIKKGSVIWLGNGEFTYIGDSPKSSTLTKYPCFLVKLRV
jgi:hypothetical protein